MCVMSVNMFSLHVRYGVIIWVMSFKKGNHLKSGWWT